MKRLSLLLLVLAIDACRTPTAITVHVLSDVPCAAQRGVTVVAAAPGEYELAPPTGRSTRCAPVGNGLYDMGRIVLSPRDDGSDRIGIRAVVGVSRDAEACTGTNIGGCIVARRLLGYLPHTELTVQMILRQECEGVACGPDSTCVGRVCRPAEIDPKRCENGCADEVVSNSCDSPGKVECTAGKRVTCMPDRTLKVEDCGLSCSATTCLGASRVITMGANDEMGGGTTCALVAGEVYCWGSNLYNRAGVTGPTSIATPNKVPGLTGIAEISGGGTALSVYARDTGGAVYCFGLGTSGQCGAPASGLVSPRKIVDDKGVELSGIKRISTGSVFGCMIASGGDVLCVGENGLGQLGRGTMDVQSAVPLPVDRTNWSGRAVDLACATNSCCLIDDAGALACWGNNAQGQVGIGSTATDVRVPTRVTLEAKPRTIAAGDQSFCAALEDGGVACWGADFRKIFVDRSGHQRTPLRLAAFDGKDVIDFAIGLDRGHYARLKSGAVLGWGANGLRVDVVDNVPELMGATSMAVATAHACAVVAGGVQCWGGNATGQLGDGSTGHPKPAPITWK